MSDGPGPFEQMREMRVRASMRAQRERALLLDVAQKAEALLATLPTEQDHVMCSSCGNNLPVPCTRPAVRAELEQAILDFETWKACNP